MVPVLVLAYLLGFVVVGAHQGLVQVYRERPGPPASRGPRGGACAHACGDAYRSNLGGCDGDSVCIEQLQIDDVLCVSACRQDSMGPDVDPVAVDQTGADCMSACCMLSSFVMTDCRPGGSEDCACRGRWACACASENETISMGVALADGRSFVTRLRPGAAPAGRSVVTALDGAAMWVAEPNAVVRYAGEQTLNARFALIGAEHVIMSDSELALRLPKASLVFAWTPSESPRASFSDGRNETAVWRIPVVSRRRLARRRVCWNAQTRTIAAPQGSCGQSPSPNCSQCANYDCAAGCGLDPGCTCTDTALDRLATQGFDCAIMTNVAFRAKLDSFHPIHTVVF
jgi:hypothetical protein